MPTFRAPTDMLRLIRRLPKSTPLASCQSAAPLLSVRPIHSTPLRQASEVPRDPSAPPDIQAFYDKLVSHPGAMEALINARKMMQDKGYDTTRPPTTMEIMKLGMDSDMREAGTKLMTELKAAGVEMKPEVLKALFDKMKPKSS